MPLAAAHSATGTFHSFAAAWTNIMRAVAPPLRTYCCDARIPILPPVLKLPHTRLRAALWPGVGYSVVTFDQSHSSSSATSWARPVSEPCPISERAIRMTTVSSGRITTHALTSGEPSAARTTLGPPNGILNPNASPPPTAAVPTMKARRSNRGKWVTTFPQLGVWARLEVCLYRYRSSRAGIVPVTRSAASCGRSDRHRETWRV